MRRFISVLVLPAIVATAQWAPAQQRDAMPDNRSIDELVECLGAESPIQRLNAAKSLGEKGPEAIRAILRSLDDDDWRVRRGGTDALAAMETPDKKAIGRLIRLAKDENGWVRDGVAIALGKFGEDAAPAAEVLAVLCADEESWVRYSAIGSLKSVTKDPEILLPAAVALIRVPDTCWRARGTAVGLLGQYGEGYKPATAALFHLMEHPSEGMWCSIPSAVDVLLKLGTAPETVQRAITESETRRSAGRLELLVRRGDKRIKVTVPLRVMGEYSDTWPTKCEKSTKILREACGYLATTQYPDGHVPGEVGMFTAYGGLMLLASDNPDFLDNARRAAHWLSEQDYRAMELNAWPSGYAGLMMAEYYLKTGDPTVLPKLQDVANFIAEGQMACGSWAHNMPWGGYGAVNQVGLVCLIALTSAKECGIKVDQAVLDRSDAFFSKYVGKGWVPYGDHRPWMGPSSNGKGALAAVAFDLLGTSAEAVRMFGRGVADSYDYREIGHTGSYFSFMWGPLAARHAGADRLQKFLDAQQSYYDLARTYEGGIVCQPNPENLGGRTPGSYTFDGPEGTTAGMALFYAMPLKSLRVLGAPKSVFGAEASEPVAGLRRLYEQRKWDELDARIGGLGEYRSFSHQQRRHIEQLAVAAKMQQESVALTLTQIERYAADEDPYRAAELLAGLERLLGEDSAQLTEAQALIAYHGREVEAGREYYESWDKLMFYRTMYWTGYGRHAKRQLEKLGPAGPKPWNVLLASSRLEPQPWRVLRSGDTADAPAIELPADWQQQPDFDDSAWAEETGPITLKAPRNVEDNSTHAYVRRTFTVDDTNYTQLRLRVLGVRDQVADVSLNGVRIAQLIDGEKKGYVTVPLRPEAVALLHKGVNCLTAHCYSEEGKSLSLDLGLEATQY